MGVFLQRLGMLIQLLREIQPILVVGGSSKKQGAGATEDDVDWPEGTLVGDLAVIAYRIDDLDAINTPAGWTGSAYIVDTDNGAGGNRTKIMHKILDAADITAGLVTITHDAGRTAHICYTIRDASGNIEITSFEDASASDTPNPPSNTPSWGSKETIWIAGCAWPYGDMEVTTWPTGYDIHQIEEGNNLNNNGGADLATAIKIVEAATEDPSEFTLSNRTNQFPSAWTIAVEPSFTPPAGIGEYLSKYWRCLIITTQGANRTSAVEIELREAEDGSDVTTGGTASASTEFGGSPASNAFDDNTGTQWRDNVTLKPAWIRYDFADRKGISEVSYQCGTTILEAPGNIEIQVKLPANTQWLTIGAFPGQAAWSSLEARLFNSFTSNLLYLSADSPSASILEAYTITGAPSDGVGAHILEVYTIVEV